MKPNKVKEVLGFVPQTPLASPLALASPFGRRGDAARSLLPRRGTSRETARAQWLPNLRRSLVLALTELYCYISPTMENIGEMVKLLQLSLWNQRLIK
ncbi:hypothetical protein [Nostoc sp.]|uniref:hypothetical protein n=1 Tax=Nostoc sp. TaxID=1180 RepID=UPI002FFB1BCC